MCSLPTSITHADLGLIPDGTIHRLGISRLSLLRRLKLDSDTGELFSPLITLPASLTDLTIVASITLDQLSMISATVTAFRGTLVIEPSDVELLPVGVLNATAFAEFVRSKYLPQVPKANCHLSFRADHITNAVNRSPELQNQVTEFDDFSFDSTLFRQLGPDKNMPPNLTSLSLSNLSHHIIIAAS